VWQKISLYFRLLTSALTANFASALVIELRRGSLPDNRDFLRIKFKNGTDDDFNTFHVFDHNGDIPLTEFIYRVEVCVSQSISVDMSLKTDFVSSGCRNQF
jgi:hypothetical protein